MKKVTEKDQPQNAMPNSYVVGIGASAGGLEAINELFDNMPATTGFSFIIIQHLSPDYKSLMADLLSKHTEMQVLEAADGMTLLPNCIYLIPPRKTLTLQDSRLKVVEKIRDHQPNTAIDIFFESLARDKAERSVGIILSGTGTDGTKGIQAIKDSGGTIVVQDPATAQFDGMPNSAVSTGYVDLILSPDMIAEELLEFIKEAPLLRSFKVLSIQEEAFVQEILALVFRITGHDFSNYKRPTIYRRIAKRMAELNIKSIGEYFECLTRQSEEVQRLCKEFLLHVTRFFRDEQAFDTLKTAVIPDIFARKDSNDMIKVWVAGCSTGEEAYSLAILFDEFLGRQHTHDRDVKIFASDISQDVIDYASKGLYTADQVKNVSAERLKRYFVKDGGGYRVMPAIRKMIVFAKHDMLKDPPFSKIDLLTCRNALIYMNPALQKSILQKFHFSIIDDGYLFLGPSENISILKEVMAEVDKKWKIYRCVSKTRVADLESFSNPADGAINRTTSFVKAKNALNHLSDIFRDTLMEEYGFAGVFVDKNFEVKQAMGHFRKFMDFPENNFNFNLLKLVPTDLSIALSTGIRKAMKDNERVVLRNIRYVHDKVEKLVTLIIKPYVIQKSYMQPFLFIVLKEEEPIAKKVSALSTISTGTYSNERIRQLEQELIDTKENLQALLEEVESSNEELQSSNEEIISSNEELQSTNEELQSLNEELHTVNAEHQLKIRELIELNDDLNNYFRNSDIGQILIDRRLVIRKFTPMATRQVNLIASDIGRSIVDISTNMRDSNFVNDIKSVMQSGQVMQKEVPMDEKTYLMRIAPYLRQNNQTDGVVVSFVDVSEIKRLNNTLEAVYNSSTSGILGLQAIRDDRNALVDFEFVSANKASLALLELPEGIVHRRFRELYGHMESRIFDAYKEVVESGETRAFEFYNLEWNRWFEIIAVKMMDGLVVTFTDITDRKSSSEKIERGYEELKITSQQLENTNNELQKSNMDLMQFASVASHDLKEPLRKIQVFGNMLREKIDGKLERQEADYLGKMINSSNRMQSLIDNILTLARLSRVDTPYTEVDLNDVINQIIDDLEISIRDKVVKFNVQKLPVIRGIEGQLHQLFQNLISNAIKFNNGRPVIDIWEELLSPALEEEFRVNASEYVSVVVADNGIGFDERFSQKIFGIFQRLDPTNYQGTGIGLAIGKKIIDNHKGYIRAHSQPGKGSRFTILLPK
jgi:two-component system CheB/CheR fusion protein